MEEKILDTQQAETLPIKWHKFQKNFLMWFIALFYCARAFLTASGNIYYTASARDAVYAGMPLLKILDYAFAAHCTAAAALMIISAIRLNKRGAGMMRKTYIALAIGEGVYVLLRWAIAGLPPINIQCAALLIAHVLLYFINKGYYRKRNDLFIGKEAL